MIQCYKLFRIPCWGGSSCPNSLGGLTWVNLEAREKRLGWSLEVCQRVFCSFFAMSQSASVLVRINRRLNYPVPVEPCRCSSDLFAARSWCDASISRKSHRSSGFATSRVFVTFAPRHFHHCCSCRRCLCCFLIAALLTLSFTNFAVVRKTATQMPVPLVLLVLRLLLVLLVRLVLLVLLVQLVLPALVVLLVLLHSH